ncbi:MAG: hypothetical protein IPN42_01120 [Methylococcaceae bacterium]|nr:hypothetical protein [Methylococcaceae bacterium]
MKLSTKLGVIGLFSMFIGFTATLAYALPSQEVETTYYSGPNYATEVGSKVLSCQGGIYSQGKWSKYAVSTKTPCNTGGMAYMNCYANGRLTICPVNICDSSLFICR